MTRSDSAVRDIAAEILVAVAPIVVTHLLDVRRDRLRVHRETPHAPAGERESFAAYAARRRGAR